LDKKFLLSHFRASAKEWHDWCWQLKNRVTNVQFLEQITGQWHENSAGLNKVTAVYPFAITPYYLSLMKNNDTGIDPIRAQSVPDIREISPDTECPVDPLQEDMHMPVFQLIHRYPDRCLAMVTETCAVYCRHCNRKRFWSMPHHGNLKKRWQAMMNYITATPHIREVIISGGDPLLLKDTVLEYLLSSLKRITHVEVLRIGSRTPVVLPMRITQNLCRIFKRYRPLWFNTQFNHPREITPEAARACNRLQEAGIPVSNQSVLLKGINDSADTMKELLNGLQKISVRPYYLFHCDPAKGCAHFRTDLQSGIALMEKIWQQCSGLCLPQYVADVPGRDGKIPLYTMSDAVKKGLKKYKHFFDKIQ